MFCTAAVTRKSHHRLRLTRSFNVRTAAVTQHHSTLACNSESGENQSQKGRDFNKDFLLRQSILIKLFEQCASPDSHLLVSC